jgi:hypothetical protein
MLFGTYQRLLVDNKLDPHKLLEVSRSAGCGLTSWQAAGRDVDWLVPELVGHVFAGLSLRRLLLVGSSRSTLRGAVLAMTEPHRNVVPPVHRCTLPEPASNVVDPQPCLMTHAAARRLAGTHASMSGL